MKSAQSYAAPKKNQQETTNKCDEINKREKTTFHKFSFFTKVAYPGGRCVNLFLFFWGGKKGPGCHAL